MQMSGVIRSILELFQARLEQQPNRTAFIALKHGEHEADRVTYGELDARAGSVAARLQATLEPGQRALLLYPTGIDFVAAFLDCLYAGVVAVPAFPPGRRRRDQRLQAIVENWRPSLALIDSATLNTLTSHGQPLSDLEGIPVLAPDRGSTQMQAHEDWVHPDLDLETLAFLQYTSGSTGTPKGVMVTHGNVLANVSQVASRIKINENSIFAS